MKGNETDVPNLEEIPFFEKPPDTIVPILQAPVNAPEELASSYCVMWPCRLCGALAYHWSDLSKHICTSSSKCYPCTICEYIFDTRKLLNKHYNEAHNIANVQVGYSCSICSANLRTSSNLNKHLDMHKKIELIKCNLCQNMIQKNSYTSHIKAHSENGSLHLVCQSCNRSFKGEIELEAHKPYCHLRTSEEDNLRCAICRLEYKNVAELREHMVSHDVPIKLHLCSFCPKSYNRLLDKIVHERIHTRSKPFSCDRCGRCFRLRNSLTAHVRTHTGERPFKCPVCEKPFRTKHLLRSHIVIHTAQFYFRCKHCHKTFHTKEAVEKHESAHKQLFICVECNRTFYSQRFAKKHMENHKRKELKYTCNMCPNMFTRASYYETHLRTKHGMDTAASILMSSKRIYEQMEENLTQEQSSKEKNDG